MGTRLEQGLIQVYTGNGKGKSTAAFGLALRALGQGLKVLIIQFMKTGDYGEITSLKRFEPEIELYSFGRKGFIRAGYAKEEDIDLAVEALELAATKMATGMYDLIILDEINNALWFKLLSEEQVLEFLENKPNHVELCITGRNAPESIMEKAHLVTEMKEIKHPYQLGIGSRKGIEF